MRNVDVESGRINGTVSVGARNAAMSTSGRKEDVDYSGAIIPLALFKAAAKRGGILDEDATIHYNAYVSGMSLHYGGAAKKAAGLLATSPPLSDEERTERKAAGLQKARAVKTAKSAILGVLNIAELRRLAAEAGVVVTDEVLARLVGTGK